MSTDFSLELRLARRKAGLTQSDVAHLLNAPQSTVSRLEKNRTQPTIEQVVTLSLIYGRSFECLFAEIVKSARRDLSERLPALPDDVRQHVGTFNRASSLARLSDRLATEPMEYDAAA